MEVIGYGSVYFCGNMLVICGDGFEGKCCFVLGLGNVVIYIVEKVILLGVKVFMFFDFFGFIYDFEGIDEEKFVFVKEIKEVCCG